MINLINNDDVFNFRIPYSIAGKMSPRESTLHGDGSLDPQNPHEKPDKHGGPPIVPNLRRQRLGIPEAS